VIQDAVSEEAPEAPGGSRARPPLIRRLWSAIGRPWVLLLPLFVLTLPLITPYVRGDGVGYYAWLRSPVIDGDLQFENEFRRGDPLFLENMFDQQGRIKALLRTPTGHVSNQWNVGTAVLWAPFFLLGHGVAHVGSAAGIDWSTDGYSLPYLWLTAFGTAVLAFLGLLLSFRIAGKATSAPAALLGVLVVWGASSLPVYQYFLPFWPFGAGVFVAAALLWVWWSGRGWSMGRWAGLGILCGLALAIHPVGVAWLALPVVSLAWLDRGDLGQRLRAGAILLSATVIGAAPQWVGKAIVQGSPLRTGYRTTWDFLRPDLVRVLVGARHGLLSWTPVAAFALVGLWFLWRRDRRLAIGLLGVFLTMLYLVAAYTKPEESSFGNRFFVWFVPGFVVGAAALIDSVRLRWRRVVPAVAVALVVWNALFAFQWAWGMLPKREAVEWGPMVRNQFTTAPRELVHAVRLFATDRQAFVRVVQEKDVQRVEAGTDVVPRP
jgi:hypothetical protein